MLTRSLKLLSLCLLVLVTSAGIAKAQNYYGAIAYNDRTGAYGASYDYPNRRGAEIRALNECGGGCSIKTWTRNACAALADWRGSNGAYAFGHNWHTNLVQAKNSARRACAARAYGSCSVRVWICTTRR